MKTKIKKKQIIAVPTAQKTKKSLVAVRSAPKVSSKALSKPRSVHSKENTLAYYNCLLEKIANPTNDKVKITALCHNCKHNKGKVKATQEECKGKLIKEVAKSYLAFGKNLGR